MEGPVALGGILDDTPLKKGPELIREQVLYVSLADPTRLLVPDNEREWTFWRAGYRTIHQPHNLRLIPLYEIRDECYQVYFPVEERG